MLDHIGKPNAANVGFTQWRENIVQLASQPNVYCKVSGIVPEAENKAWHKDQIKRYVDVAFEYFGFNRVIFGSDWPVVNLSSSFQEWYTTLCELSDGISPQNLFNLFYGNACRFYRI